MRAVLYGIVLAICLVYGLGAPITRAGVDNSAIEAAIKKATGFILSKQKDGHWEKATEGKYTNDNTHTGGQWGGVTAMATYALLATGHSPQDPAIAKAIEFLKKADIRGTYALSMRMQVWLLLPETKETRELMKKDATVLLNMTQSQGTAMGMHDYTIAQKTYSHSRSQYAVLGMWAAEQMGMEVPLKYWEASEGGWLDHQDASGGWTYKKKNETDIPLTPGMTAAGVATLFITQDYMHATKAVDCRGTQANPASTAIDKGVAWLAQHFDKIATSKRYERDFPFATLYAVERVGVAGGLKYFGTHDWYEKGVEWLIKVQKSDGSFGLPGSMDAIFGPIVETSFATLFLVRGRAPVAFAKLDYSAGSAKPVAWNQRPRDIANLVRWIGRSLERDLNWQVVNLQVTPEEWLDAPILYVSGSQPLEISDQNSAKFKAFIEMGGMIVGHADCSGVGFSSSFRKLGEKLFPKSEFRELPPTHIVYNNNFKHANWKFKPAVHGLSNGTRELMLLIHGGDPARFWQIRAAKGREESWQLAANMFLYVSDRKDLRYKGDTHVVQANKSAASKGEVSVARIEYAENWDPEPGGWRRLSTILHNQGLKTVVTPVPLENGKLDAGKFKMAHLTGTTKVKFSDAQMDELRNYVSKGGLLVIDAAGGASDFADAADVLVRTLYPQTPAKQLPPEHALYKDASGQAMAIGYRTFAQRTLLGNARAGRLMGVELDNRVAVILSREDLSTGMVGQHVDGIIGYSPETATALMRNIVMSVAPKIAPAATKPAAPSKPTTKPATAKPTKKSGTKK